MCKSSIFKKLGNIIFCIFDSQSWSVESASAPLTIQDYIILPYRLVIMEMKRYFDPFTFVESYKLVPLHFNKNLIKSYHLVQGRARFLAKPDATKAKPVGNLGWP